jgi:hypothetical protein
LHLPVDRRSKPTAAEFPNGCGSKGVESGGGGYSGPSTQEATERTTKHHGDRQTGFHGVTFDLIPVQHLSLKAGRDHGRCVRHAENA